MQPSWLDDSPQPVLFQATPEARVLVLDADELSNLKASKNESIKACLDALLAELANQV